MSMCCVCAHTIWVVTLGIHPSAGLLSPKTGQMGDVLPYTLLGTGLLVRKVSTGYMHKCAILSNSYNKCWGSNGYRQVGYGDMSARGDGPN